MTISNGPGGQGRLDKAKRRLSIARLLFSAACFTTFFSLTMSLRADSFSLEASPSTVYLKQDEKANSTIAVHPAGGFNGSVTLLASRLPTGVTASFDPESTTSASKLVFVAAKEATTGLSSITITGTSGNLTQSVTISLAVTAATTVRDKSGRPSTAAHFESWSLVVGHARPPAPAAYRRGLSARTLQRQAGGRGHPLKQFEPPPRMNALVSLSISSPIASPIRPLAVAATGGGRRALELADKPCEAPAMLLGCGLRPSAAAARTMGRIARATACRASRSHTSRPFTADPGRTCPAGARRGSSIGRGPGQSDRFHYRLEPSRLLGSGIA